MEAPAQSLAEKRREMRRRRILLNSEDRMKKLMGVSPENSSTSDLTEPPSVCNNSIQAEPLRADTNDSHTLPEHITTANSHTFSQPNAAPSHTHVATTTANSQEASSTYGPQSGAELLDSLVSSVLQRGMPGANRKDTHNHANSDDTLMTAPATTVDDTAVTTNNDHLGFYRARQIICLVAGLLVRLSLLTSFGVDYVQTMVYPFFTLEMALVGYQKAADIDLSIGVSGGLWLTALTLSGVRQDIIHTYKQLMGAVSSASDDFAVYLFAFIVSHLCIAVAYG